MAAGKLIGGKRPKLVKARKSGWTKAKQDKFLKVLAETCNIAMACREAKVSSTTVYRERERNAAFRAGWVQAVARSYEQLELMLLRRQMDGTVKEVRRADGSVEKIVEYSDRIALQLLRQHKDSASEALAAENEDDGDAEQSCKRIMRMVDGVRRRMGLPDDSGEDGEDGLQAA